ncbi:hypothetical protein [Nocardioides zeae]
MTLTVHFTKKAGAPVRYVSDESAPAAAIREVDLERKFHLSAKDLANKVKLTVPRATALRRHLGVDADPACTHTFVFDSQRIQRFSDNATRKMQTAVESLDMEVVWDAHKPAGRGKPRPPCELAGCAA